MDLYEVKIKGVDLILRVRANSNELARMKTRHLTRCLVLGEVDTEDIEEQNPDIILSSVAFNQEGRIRTPRIEVEKIQTD